MDPREHLWAVVLAAGDGRRLQGLTTIRAGLAVPKQFCSLERGPSLLQEALQRARSVAAPERICTIVADQHRQWWADHLEAVLPENLIVQPRNRGTANGILLPLLEILERDPDARILLLPSDHHVRDEERLACALRYAAFPPESAWAEILLLGLAARSADPELGYIVPRREAGHTHHALDRFVEKPDPGRAQRLIENGALWNAFIIAADASALLKLFERRYPDIVAAMRDAVRARANGSAGDAALAELYETLPELDFSRNILQGQEQHLRVLPVPDCGWSDLGTPQRVAEALRGLGPVTGRRAPAAFGRRVLVSLAAQQQRLGLVPGATGAARNHEIATRA
jgi:mannose-1-phosphate guanylyltransferase